MTLKDLEQYVRTYNKAVYRLMASGRSAPSESRLKAFETSIDFCFCPDFREFTLSPLGGLIVEVCEELWRRPEPLPAGLGEQNLWSIRVFGIAAGVPRNLDLRAELAALPEVESDLIPFMARGEEPERYCFDLDHQIVRWSPEDGSREVVDQSFYPLLLSEIRGLEERWRILSEAPAPKKKRRSRKKKAD